MGLFFPSAEAGCSLWLSRLCVAVCAVVWKSEGKVPAQTVCGASVLLHHYALKI